MTYLKMKGQEASSWLKMVTRKMKLETEVLSDTVQCYVARRRREKNFSFGWDTYMGPSALEPPAGLGGFQNALQGWGSKNGL